ncbi:MAG: asparagine--tRNA ligase [Caldicoprobacterales bacterium]|nr:asparagine--tRNA ligase [Clostridia bacterium]MDI9513198.1 asparagine--tRNA ligase [Bacillota bacterium]
MREGFITIKELFKDPQAYYGKTIKLGGWIRNIRDSKVFGFIDLNDGSYFKNLQVVFEADRIDNFDQVARLGVGSAIIAEGVLTESPGAKQPFELKADQITVEGPSPSDYPLQKKRHTFEYLRTIAHLRPRSNTFSAVFRLRSILSYAIHKFFMERDFVYVHTPIITSADAEGAGEMFKVTTLDPDKMARDDQGRPTYEDDFFGKLTNLTVSGQLPAEAFALAFRNVYTFGPTFRAENSHTARHASEFWMIEPEMAFADLEDDMDLAEDMMKFIINYCLENAPEEMDFFNKFIDKGLLERLDNVLNSEFKRITYTEAVSLLEKSGEKFDYPVKWGMDLQTEHERYLTEKTFKGPVFVTDYPKEIKAFYMRLNDDQKTVAAMDLLVPGVGEIVGGSQREERIEILDKRLDELQMNKEEYWWYRDLRRYGGTHHAGFGLGFERAIMYLSGMTNIRDVIPFPRTPNSAEF